MLEHQLKIEADMRAEAKLRLDEDNRKTTKRTSWSESKLGIRYTIQATKKFSDAVAKAMDVSTRQGKGSNVRAWKLLADSGLSPQTVAYLFCKGVYNHLPLVHRKPLKRVTFCMKVAGLIHDEVRMRHFASTKERKNLLKTLFKQFDKRTYPREWRKRTIKNYFHSEQLTWNVWSERERVMIGYALLVLFRDTTGLLSAPKNQAYIQPTSELLDHVADTMLHRVTDFILYKPMVVPPVPWSEDNLFRGGYLTNDVKPFAIIKGATKRDVPRFESMDWSQVLPAVNSLQTTAWRVNSRMLNMLEWAMFERNGEIGGLPRSNPKPLPPAPLGYGEDEEITKEHNKLCFLIHSENREIISKRLHVLATIAVGRQFKSYPAIYFPHNLDTRGRAYPLPVFLQPQGPDFVKACLEFSEGVRINTDEARTWLAIAGANAYGNDKIPLQSRADWVAANEEWILEIAKDPKSDLRWQDASEPFQFLRFCLEWAGFKTDPNFVSHMVVPVDATCSGLQHYSMMLRDEVGGRSVNLVPGLSRQDIYQDVADVVIAELMERNDEIARDLISFGINRKITKRQVMVVPYAGTFASCMEYTRTAVAEKIKEGYPCNWDASNSTEHTARIVLLSKLIWGAIDKTVIKGKEAMRWISTAAREYSHWANSTLQGDAYAKRMSWVTPDGFEVIHFRASSKEHQVDTYLDGRVRLTIHTDTEKLSPADMALAVAPNFVHSMDATLLRMSVMKGLTLEHPITQFAMVHDSFGVHATRMGEFLRSCIKPAFVEMYANDVLAEFASRLPFEVSSEIDGLPQPGNLNPQGVKDSEFFFS